MTVFCNDMIPGFSVNTALLGPDEAHIYAVDINKADFAGNQHLIAPDEQEKANRYRQPADAHRLLAGRIYIKRLLARYTNADAGDIIIKPGANKKPFAVDRHDNQLLQFNISHSGNIVLLVISHKTVGIDIEEIKNIDLKDFVYNILSEQEIVVVSRSEDRRKTFFKFWTRKEALLKATGLGLVDCLPQVEMLDGVNHFGSVPFNDQDFEIFTYNPADNYTASVCVEKGTIPLFYNAENL
ncbi:MAG: 4'-phosphopantetheinyl transferase superfamily protein [Niabella sp.]